MAGGGPDDVDRQQRDVAQRLERDRVAATEQGTEERNDDEHDEPRQADDQGEVARQTSDVAASHRAPTLIARVARPTSPPISASASAKTSAIADANATLPVATERMNA